MNQEMERSKADQCSSQMRYPTDNTQNDLFITAQGRLRAMGEPIVNEWESNSQFENNWILDINRNYLNRMPLDTLRNDRFIQNSLFYKPTSGHYLCKIFSKYWSLFPMDKSQFWDIAKEGYR